MPQVHAVTALADPHEGLELEDARHPSVRYDQHCYEQGGQHRNQGDAASIGERRVAGRAHDHDDKPCERCNAHHVECGARAGRFALGASVPEDCRRPDEGEERAD